jgi:hypothetical protein
VRTLTGSTVAVTAVSGALSRSVAARRIERRRPSDSATTMKVGPRAERNATTRRR